MKSKLALIGALLAVYVGVPLAFGGDSYVMSLVVASMVIGGVALSWALLGNCRIPDDCIDSKRYPLFIAREAMRALVYDLTQAQGEST